jgi:hypothetical protein
MVIATIVLKAKTTPTSDGTLKEKEGSNNPHVSELYVLLRYVGSQQLCKCWLR